ncbi:MAG: hypothetical protein AAB965_01180 [Patescibacteria group bacterium]
MGKKILVVTKDIGGGFNTLYPVVNLLRKEGYEVTVVAEGLSLKKWMGSGEEVYGGAGKCDASLMRYDIEMADAFEEVRPDAVIAELGAPIHLAEVFALGANRRDIPLIFIEDLWGVSSRSKAIPRLVCSVDDFGRFMATEQYSLGGDTKVIATGNPAMDALANVRASDSLQNSLGGVYTRGKRIVVALGQDESTTPMLEGLVEALEQEGNYILIPRFHPKWLSDPSKAEHCNRWHSILDRAKRGSVLWLNNESTHEILTLSHIAVSIYSTVLVEAAILGTIPVSWMSPIGQEKMAQALGGLRKFPLVSTGAAIGVSSADEFLSLVPKHQTAKSGAQLRETTRMVPSDGRNTERVVRAISDLLSR